MLWAVTPLLVTILTFGIFVAMGKELTADVAFGALALFNVMRFPLNIFPMLIAQLIEAKISLKRYNTILSSSFLPLLRFPFLLSSKIWLLFGCGVVDCVVVAHCDCLLK